MSFLEKVPSPHMKLKEDLGLDSLKLVELIVSMEEAFQIEIDESDLDPASLQTVSQIYALAGKYMEG